jgi:aminomethyltransferase
MTETLRRTPLFACHAAARLVPFASWEMPVYYTSITQEHTAVRSACGLFDVSHMGELEVRGERALEFLQRLTSNDLARISPGRAQYTFLLNERGGVIDDIIVYQLADSHYLLCVNAANTAKDFGWVTSQLERGVEASDRSMDYAQLALQGPRAGEILSRARLVTSAEWTGLKSFSFLVRESESLIIARTGYTGEDGVEIFMPPTQAVAVWKLLLAAGSEYGILPCGLGARDTLRLEACYPLYGHELREDILAAESGLGWAIRLDKGDFIGAAPLRAAAERGFARKLVALEVLDPGIVREGAHLFSPPGEEVGFVTSGTKTPTVAKAVALAYARSAHTQVGGELRAEVRGNHLCCRVVKPPFYRRKST